MRALRGVAVASAERLGAARSGRLRRSVLPPPAQAEAQVLGQQPCLRPVHDPALAGAGLLVEVERGGAGSDVQPRGHSAVERDGDDVAVGVLDVELGVREQDVEDRAVELAHDRRGGEHVGWDVVDDPADRLAVVELDALDDERARARFDRQPPGGLAVDLDLGDVQLGAGDLAAGGARERLERAEPVEPWR